jgi:hypothetical protein
MVCKMSQSYKILKDLADIIVNASYEERNLTSIECEYIDTMFSKALKLSSSEDEN